MSLPFFPMYPRDFEADTSHLTLEEDGAYNRLLRLCWMTAGCSLPDDAAWIMRRMRVDQETFDRVVRVVLDEFFVRKSGRVSNARLVKENISSKEKHEKRKKAGSQGGKSKALKTNENHSSNVKAMLKQPEPEPEPYIGSSSSAREQPIFREQVLKAMGHDISGVTATGQFVYNPTQLFEVQRWRDDLGLSEEEIISVIENTPCQNGPPSTPKYYSKAMQRFAGEKNQPKLKSIPGGENNRKSTHNTEHLQRIINAAAEGSSKQDWG